MQAPSQPAHRSLRRRHNPVEIMSLFIIAVSNVSLVPGAVATTDPDYSLQWGLHNVGQTVAGQTGIAGADIDIKSAWEIHDGVPAIVVAIVGTGVDPHPEFAGRLLPGAAFIGDLFDTSDSHGPGTHVAGIIAAGRNDGLGIAGINPHSLILPVRITTGTQSNEAAAAAGIVWAVDQGARVMVITRTYHTGSPALADAIAYAADHDVFVVAPVGDEENPEVLYPAAFAGCVAVSATNNRDEFASISNWGHGVELAAPGKDIWSTARRGSAYEYRSGSTIASAFVAGVASLIRSYAPQLSAPEIRQLLIETAADLGSPGVDDRFGAGRLSAHAAFTQARAPALRFEPLGSLPSYVSTMDGAAFRVRIASVAEQLLPASALLFHRSGIGPFAPRALKGIKGHTYEVTIPPATCGSTVEFYLRAAGNLGTIVHEPLAAPTHVHVAETIIPYTVFYDDFDEDRGWTVGIPGGEPVSGIWVRAVPVGTSVQPGFDATPGPGGACYLTGQYFGGAESLTDVDGGPLTLNSPAIVLPEGDVELSFRAWMRSQNGMLDVLLVDVSTDDGVSWVSIDSIETGTGWRDFTYRLSDFPELTGHLLRVRFSVSDVPNDSLTEAAVDEVRVRSLRCVLLRGDANGDGVVNLADYVSWITCFTGPHALPADGSCHAADFNGDGTVDLRDYGVLQQWLGTP